MGFFEGGAQPNGLARCLRLAFWCQVLRGQSSVSSILSDETARMSFFTLWFSHLASWEFNYGSAVPLGEETNERAKVEDFFLAATRLMHSCDRVRSALDSWMVPPILRTAGVADALRNRAQTVLVCVLGGLGEYIEQRSISSQENVGRLLYRE